MQYLKVEDGIITGHFCSNKKLPDMVEVEDFCGIVGDKIEDIETPSGKVKYIPETEEEIKANESMAKEALEALEIQNKKNNALNYLKSTDFYFTVDKYAQLSEERKAELTELREDARIIIREIQGV